MLGGGRRCAIAAPAVDHGRSGSVKPGSPGRGSARVGHGAGGPAPTRARAQATVGHGARDRHSARTSARERERRSAAPQDLHAAPPPARERRSSRRTRRARSAGRIASRAQTHRAAAKRCIDAASGSRARKHRATVRRARGEHSDLLARGSTGRSVGERVTSFRTPSCAVAPSRRERPPDRADTLAVVDGSGEFPRGTTDRPCASLRTRRPLRGTPNASHAMSLSEIDAPRRPASRGCRVQRPRR